MYAKIYNLKFVNPTDAKVASSYFAENLAKFIRPCNMQSINISLGPCGSLSITAKFDSGTGWPSFSEALPGAFKTKIDYSFGIKRVEYHCVKCGAHHGHVFNDGPRESGKRFCNNGLCLIFKPE